MSKYIKVICHFVEGKTIQDLAEAVNAVWGTGNPDAEQVEKMLPSVNTPPQNGYVAIRMTEAQAKNLEEYSKINDLSWITDWWRIEWPQFETKVDGEGKEEYQALIPYDPVTWEELIVDENGDPVQFDILDPETGEPTGETETRTIAKYLGGFA